MGQVRGAERAERADGERPRAAGLCGWVGKERGGGRARTPGWASREFGGQQGSVDEQEEEQGEERSQRPGDPHRMGLSGPLEGYLSLP